MKAPIIRSDMIETICDKRFIRVYDLQYAPGKHYYNASRRKAEDLVALKSPEDAKAMLPDAVSCVVILCLPDREPLLLLTEEYRYPAGRFLLSIPAGLIDPADKASEHPLVKTAVREIFEETGLTVTEGDSVRVISSFLYSTPGMTDESNALMSVVMHPSDLGKLSQDGAEGSECFDGFVLLTETQARELLASGRDAGGDFFSIFTWAALMWFISGMWKV